MESELRPTDPSGTTVSEPDIADLARSIADSVPTLGELRRFVDLHQIQGVLDWVTDYHADPEIQRIMHERGFGTQQPDQSKK